MHRWRGASDGNHQLLGVFPDGFRKGVVLCRVREHHSTSYIGATLLPNARLVGKKRFSLRDGQGESDGKGQGCATCMGELRWGVVSD